MTSVNNMAEAEELLAKYVPLAREITGKDITLDRTRQLMKVLGNPEERLKIIHIAGTSGKTSTAYYIASLLAAAGRKTGLTVSPHIDTVRERVQINMQPASETEFVNALNELIGIIEASDVEPTYFELLVAFAYWYFERQGVDYAVVETGMGGLHDSTNVAANPDKVCVITDIGLDHMHVLGNTVPEIARQKAGIIHDNNKVFMHGQDDRIMQVIHGQCADKNAELTVVTDTEDDSGLPGFQHRNWSLAKAVFECIQARDNLPAIPDDKSQAIQVPGRMDEVKINGKTVMMDGAHNEQKMQAFTASFKQMYPNQKVPVLLSLKRGKEFAAVLPLLKPLTSKIILTEYQTSQDLPVVSIDAAELAAVAEKFGFEDIAVETDKEKAFQLLLSEPGDLAVITGSFYLIGQLRQDHVELKHGHHDETSG